MTTGSTDSKSIIYWKSGVFQVNELIHRGGRLENRSFGQLKDIKKRIMTQHQDINL